MFSSNRSLLSDHKEEQSVVTVDSTKLISQVAGLDILCKMNDMIKKCSKMFLMADHLSSVGHYNMTRCEKRCINSPQTKKKEHFYNNLPLYQREDI